MSEKSSEEIVEVSNLEPVSMLTVTPRETDRNGLKVMDRLVMLEVRGEGFIISVDELKDLLDRVWEKEAK